MDRINDKEIGILLANWSKSENELDNSEDEIYIDNDNEYLDVNNENTNDLNIEIMPVEFVTEEGNQYIIYPGRQTYTPPPVGPLTNRTRSPLIKPVLVLQHNKYLVR